MKNITVITNLNGKTACIKTVVSNKQNTIPELKGMGFTATDILAVIDGHVENIITPDRGYTVSGETISFTATEMEIIRKSYRDGNRLNAIKTIREIAGTDLRDSKTISEMMIEEGTLIK